LVTEELAAEKEPEKDNKGEYLILSTNISDTSFWAFRFQMRNFASLWRRS
jgi:hypothetical protein